MTLRIIYVGLVYLRVGYQPLLCTITYS